jgi:hypothetical protein
LNSKRITDEEIATLSIPCRIQVDANGVIAPDTIAATVVSPDFVRLRILYIKKEVDCLRVSDRTHSNLAQDLRIRTRMIGMKVLKDRRIGPDGLRSLSINFNLGMLCKG